MTVPKSKRHKSRFEVFHMIDVQNSFKSWLGTYDKLLSYQTKSSMKALYTDLFER